MEGWPVNRPAGEGNTALLRLIFYLLNVIEQVVSLESSLAAATSKLSDQQLLISDLRKMTGGEDVVKELRKRIEELEMELGEKEDQTRDLEVKLFEVSFTSADPDLSSTTTSPPPSSSLLPSQPPVAEGSIDFGLQPSTKPSTIMSSSILQTPGDSRRNTISTLHGSGLPKPGTSRLPFRPSALPTPGTGNKTRPDQTSSGIAGVFGPAKFGFGVGRQSLGIKSSKVSPPSVGGGKVVMGAKTGEVKMAKLELEIKEKTAEVGRLNIKLNAAKEKCSQMDMMKVDLEREKEKVSVCSSLFVVEKFNIPNKPYKICGM